MPRTRNNPKQYRVGNPHGVRPGLPILSFNDGTQFFEGDLFTPPTTMTLANIARRVQQGFLVEVTDG